MVRGVGLGVADFSTCLTAWGEKLPSSGFWGFGTVSQTAVIQTVSGWSSWGPWWFRGPSWHTRPWSVLNGGKLTSADPLSCLHYPLQRFAALGSAVHVPGWDVSSQDALGCPSEDGPRDLGPRADFFSCLRWNRPPRAPWFSRLWERGWPSAPIAVVCGRRGRELH